MFRSAKTAGLGEMQAQLELQLKSATSGPTLNDYPLSEIQSVCGLTLEHPQPKSLYPIDND